MGSSGEGVASRLGWDPARTWLFVVGTLEWQDPEAFPPFPKKNRRDEALVACFRAHGVPAGQIAYLQDGGATTAAIRDAFDAHLARAVEGDLLVLYFCGHGAKTEAGSAYFASYDAGSGKLPGWMVEAIPRTIERRFGGSRALLLADCCYAGSLADAVARHADRVAYACLTSSLASELSTGNWTFTEGLLYGLQGQAFVDGDGNRQITLIELAAQIADSMAFAEEQLVSFAVHGAFDPRMVVAAARTRPDPRVGQRVEVRDGDAWYRAQIIEAAGERLRVHYFGYEASDDAWVTPERIRAPARPIYPLGTAVDVLWKGAWYPATIIDVRSGVHQIHYEGFGEEWDEWVALKRMRVRG